MLSNSRELYVTEVETEANDLADIVRKSNIGCYVQAHLTAYGKPFWTVYVHTDYADRMEDARAIRKRVWGS